MILVKEGVKFHTFIPEIYGIFVVLDDVFQRRGFDCVITSAHDGHHMLASLHYKNRALDLRSRQLPAGVAAAVTAELRHKLGRDYDVVFEGEGTENEHIHVEFDPD